MATTRLRTVALVACCLMGFAAIASAAAPNSFTYQGRLTDASGNPVPDGPTNVRFIIWNSPTSTAPGDVVWNSGTVSVTTADGLFSAALGQSPMPAFPSGLFNDTSLWLGITVGADPELSPRTRLRAVPYALASGNAVSDHGSLSGLGDDDHAQYVLESGDTMTGDLFHDDARSVWRNGPEVVVEIEPSTNEIILYDDNGDRTANLGYDSINAGHLKLYEAPAADERVNLEATNNSFVSHLELYATQEDGPYTPGIEMIGGDGSRLFMHDQTGGLELAFDMLTGISGNGKVTMPDSAIDSREIHDEPGVAHRFTFGPVTASTGTDELIDSVEVIVPSNGYVLVMVSGYVDVDHTTGTATNGRVWVSDDGLLDFDNFFFASITGALPSGSYYRSFSLMMMDTVTAFSSNKYIVACDLSSGGSGADASFSRVHISAMFFPTSYGDVEFTKRPAVAGYDSPDDPEGLRAPRSEVHTITVEEHEARLQAELARQRQQLESRLIEMEARLDNLENR